MLARQLDLARCGLIAALALVALSLPGDLWPQQEMPGRQGDLTPQEIATIKDRIRQLDGRAIIGFKPVDRPRGMRPDGTPGLAPAEVAQLASDVAPRGVRVTIQFGIIPAVAATIDPDRLDELLADPNIDYVEPDYLEEPTAQTTPWGINRVNAPAAWTYTKGAGVSVGIIDTGIDEDHPDLNPIGGINLVTGGTTRADWDDNSSICSTHGTHVAGTVAALDNTIGVVGVAPEVDLYSLRVFDPEYLGISSCVVFVSHSILAIEWAATNGLDVINMSFGGLYPSFARADALFAAYSAGVFPVAAAGNDYSRGQVGFPAAQPHAIAVAAIDNSDDVASFSNTGPDIELAAPGVSVLSTWGGGVYSTISGTSMASPHAAGVAALVRAARHDLSVDEVRQVLRSTADDIGPLGFDWMSGYGVVDAGAALAAVASSNLALSLYPQDVYVTLPLGSASEGDVTIAVSNVGAAGTINWTATDDASWMSLSPTSGSATDVTNDYLSIIFDESGLSAGVYTGHVTVSGNAVNSPVSLRVQLRIAPEVALDASVTTAGTLPTGERVRYIIQGSAGQEIDVAVLTDLAAAQPLWDPVVRVYKPRELGIDANESEAMIAYNDDAFIAGLGVQSLVYRVELPEDGDYYIEVASYADASGGGFLLKARPTGPILGFSYWYIGYRAERDGSSIVTPLEMFNLTGVGSVGWTASPFPDWISVSPSSGTASASGAMVTLQDFIMPDEPSAPAGEQTEGERAPDTALDADVLWGALPAGDYVLPRQKLDEPEMAWLRAAARGVLEPPALTVEPEATTVNVTLDPAGVPLGWNYGQIAFEAADGWLPPQYVTVSIYVYSSGMEIVSGGHVSLYETTTDDTRPGNPPVMVGARDASGSIFPVPVTGSPGAPVATGLGYPGGLALGQDANWYVYDRTSGSHRIRKVARDGTKSIFVQDPLLSVPLFWLTWGPGGNLYGSTGCWTGQILEISADGSTVDPVASGLPDCVAGVAYRPGDNALYVANSYGAGLTRISLEDGSTTTLATDVSDPHAVAVGRSGMVYFTDDDGVIWSVNPDVTSSPTRLAVTPSWLKLYGLDLAEGTLVIAAYDAGEVYRYPVDDGPISHPAEEALYVGRFAPEDMTSMDYPDVGDPCAMQGEDFELTQILYTKDGSNLPVAAFVENMAWNPADITYVDMYEGDFGGTFLCNESGVGQGTLACASARAEAVGVPGVSLLSLRLNLSTALARGACVPIEKQFSELTGSGGEDYLPVLDTWSPLGFGVREWPYGDVTRDEPPAVGAADAVQILRSLVGLPLCPNCDIDMGDVDRDGSVTGSDAVFILRSLVGLPLPEHQRIGKYGLQECQVE